ncbi:putative RNA-directed DNA polymerase from transposon X-element [Toxocara canis]|uniref:Putative RNA-directed DNA polymerase from transposon X-element n=1 Tax=Toxocara canis TaxID=6265 RepID=A0A0B2VKS8_TOXCA|nr:putative RNA-directed DNA polymerase from transposon X-element [Toxocara canis]
MELRSHCTTDLQNQVAVQISSTQEESENAKPGSYPNQEISWVAYITPLLPYKLISNDRPDEGVLAAQTLEPQQEADIVDRSQCSKRRLKQDKLPAITTSHGKELQIGTTRKAKELSTSKNPKGKLIPVLSLRCVESNVVSVESKTPSLSRRSKLIKDEHEHKTKSAVETIGIYTPLIEPSFECKIDLLRNLNIASQQFPSMFMISSKKVIRMFYTSGKYKNAQVKRIKRQQSEMSSCACAPKISNCGCEADTPIRQTIPLQTQQQMQASQQYLPANQNLPAQASQQPMISPIQQYQSTVNPQPLMPQQQYQPAQQYLQSQQYQVPGKYAASPYQPSQANQVLQQNFPPQNIQPMQTTSALPPYMLSSQYQAVSQYPTTPQAQFAQQVQPFQQYQSVMQYPTYQPNAYQTTPQSSNAQYSQPAQQSSQPPSQQLSVGCGLSSGSSVSRCLCPSGYVICLRRSPSSRCCVVVKK